MDLQSFLKYLMQFAVCDVGPWKLSSGSCVGWPIWGGASAEAASKKRARATDRIPPCLGLASVRVVNCREAIEGMIAHTEEPKRRTAMSQLCLFLSVFVSSLTDPSQRNPGLGCPALSACLCVSLTASH